jgi:hypothetical protein
VNAGCLSCLGALDTVRVLMEILKKWALSTLRVLNSGARATPSLQARLKNVVQRYNTRGAIYRAQSVVLSKSLVLNYVTMAAISFNKGKIYESHICI